VAFRPDGRWPLVAAALWWSVCLTCACAHADSPGVPDDGVPPPITAVMVDSAPLIDGLLGDPCWDLATHIDGFWRERVDATEIERTEFWLCADARAVYVAFRCHDTQASEIRRDQKKRQGDLWRDDYVKFGLDVESAAHDCYNFIVNAAGTQYDEVPGGSSEKIEWKGDWRAAARVDEGGWSAELEIPFAILRYPDGQDCFRFYLLRHLAREEDFSAWPPRFARRPDLGECAFWRELATPPAPFRYVIMPYALFVLSEEEEERESLTGGLDFKGTLPSGVVTLATYRPDFRHIEDVVETIDFTYTERWLPEYRPFFQEGSWHFPSSQIFYSRRIEEMDWGAKAFGTVGAHRFGMLDAHADGGENHLVVDYDYLLGSTGQLGVSAVDRRMPGEPDNRAWGLDAHQSWPFSGGGRSIWADWRRSRTEGEGGDDESVGVGASLWRAQGLSMRASYGSIGSEFRADDGFVPETGMRQFTIAWDHQRAYDEGSLQRSEWWGLFQDGASEAGPRGEVWVEHDRYWRDGRFLWVGAARGERDGFDRTDNYIGVGWNRNDTYRKGKLSVRWGTRYGESYRHQEIVQAFRPSKRWSAELSAERVLAPGIDAEGRGIPSEYTHQVVLTTSCDVTDEKTVSARLVRRESDTNLYAVYRQRVRRGMDLLVVAGDPNADEWVSRLAVKAIWCL